MLKKLIKIVLATFVALLILGIAASFLKVDISPYAGIYGAIVMILAFAVFVLAIIDITVDVYKRKEIFTEKVIRQILFEFIAVFVVSLVISIWIKGALDLFNPVLFSVVGIVAGIKIELRSQQADRV